jgi:hypothetical protein
MLKQAIQEYSHVDNLSFKNIDITSADVRFERQFDVIVSFNTFHWIKDIQWLF